MADLDKLKGKFITLEGIDGAGKSTQAQALADYFKNQGLKVIITREPGGSPNAEMLRQVILEHKFVPMAELLLFMAARCEHVENLIKPKLAEGYTVICDRFIDSTIVYQGLNGIDQQTIMFLHSITAKIMPDITIFLNTDIARSKSRILQRSENNSYDQRRINQLEIMQQAFLKLAENNPRFLTIDGGGDSEQVNELTIQKLIKHNFYEKV